MINEYKYKNKEIIKKSQEDQPFTVNNKICPYSAQALSSVNNNMVLEAYGTSINGIQNYNEMPFAGDYAPTINCCFTDLNTQQLYQNEGILF